MDFTLQLSKPEFQVKYPNHHYITTYKHTSRVNTEAVDGFAESLLEILAWRLDPDPVVVDLVNWVENVLESHRSDCKNKVRTKVVHSHTKSLNWKVAYTDKEGVD